MDRRQHPRWRREFDSRTPLQSCTMSDANSIHVQRPTLEDHAMRNALAVLCFMFAVSPFAAAADKDAPKKEPTAKQKAQQERMKDCNAKAGERKGDERKKYMSACLKGEASGPSAKQKAQQDKMASCNKEAGAKKLTGDERKKFMSTCLKG